LSRSFGGVYCIYVKSSNKVRYLPRVFNYPLHNCRDGHATQLGGRILIFEQHTTARCSLTWTPSLARPISCGHTRWIFATHILRACAGYARLRLCVVARYTQCRDKPGDCSTLGSQHVCTIALVSEECAAPGRLHSGNTKNGMSYALRFSCHVPGNTTKENGLGTYWA
jgi:hypothetical protein